METVGREWGAERGMRPVPAPDAAEATVEGSSLETEAGQELRHWSRENGRGGRAGKGAQSRKTETRVEKGCEAQLQWAE